MSKSIYEEAIELMKLNILPRESGKTAKTKVIHALQQAHKQEKLLELYKELITVKDNMFSYCEVKNDKYYYMAETEMDLEKLIKEIKK